jgi:hypothetical protein
MSIRTTAEKNSIATKYGTDAAFLSLHSADPGTTGTSELTGGSPAYARIAATWAAPANGVVTATALFNVPSGATVAFVGVWSALTGGTFLDATAVTSQSFAAQGQYQVNATATAS